MVAIVRSGISERYRQQNASKVLKLLAQLDQQQITAKTKELEAARRRATSYYYRAQVTASERELTTLSNRLARMERFADALCVFLTYRAEHTEYLPEPETWRPGAATPSTTTQRPATYNSPTYEIPTELLCPISGELMEDPVLTADNFTYERRNIERWYVFDKAPECSNNN